MIHQVRKLLDRHDQEEPSVFLPANLLREARRQRNLPAGEVPVVCLLDPDGDAVRQLRSVGRATRSPVWACYHTELWEAEAGTLQIGIVPNAVGAPFAVLVAEQLFASGCELLLSVTSAGRLSDQLPHQCLILIERALRSEGTSQAYLPAAPFAALQPHLNAVAVKALGGAGIQIVRGATWTTDAPYRETASAIQAATASGLLAVEMEAAALYAFAEASRRDVICFAHVTNEMAVEEGDFEKGADDGLELVLSVVAAIAVAWRHRRMSPSISEEKS